MKLKGSSRSDTIQWTIKDKVQVYAMVKVQLVPAKVAFERAAKEKGVELPSSYESAPHSHIWRFKKELTLKMEKGDEATIALLREYNLIED